MQQLPVWQNKTGTPACSWRWLIFILLCNDCYDESWRSLSFPGCCVPSLHHMPLLNKYTSERNTVRKRGRKREGVTEMLADGEPMFTALDHSEQIIALDAEAEPRCIGKILFCLFFVLTSLKYLLLIYVSKIARCSNIRRNHFLVPSLLIRRCSEEKKGNCHSHSCEPGVFGWIKCQRFFTLTLSLCRIAVQLIISCVSL